MYSEIQNENYKPLMEHTVFEFLSGIANTFIGIIEDLYLFESDFVSIFTKENRLVFIGIVILFSVLMSLAIRELARRSVS